MDSWEWPGPNGHQCNAIAEIVDTKERVQCCLRFNHRSQQHRWEEVVPSRQPYRSVTWIATGPVTFVGKPSS